jgi:hypothetical protein
LQLVLPASVARSEDLAEEFANLDQDISFKEACDYLCATFRIRNAEEIWEDRLQRIEICDGELFDPIDSDCLISSTCWDVSADNQVRLYPQGIHQRAFS